MYSIFYCGVAGEEGGYWCKKNIFFSLVGRFDSVIIFSTTTLIEVSYFAPSWVTPRFSILEVMKILANILGCFYLSTNKESKFQFLTINILF